MAEFDKDIINPFLMAASSVILSLLGEKPKKEKVGLMDIGREAGRDIAVIIGMAGEIYGRVVVILNEESAKRIASRILNEDVVQLTDVSYRAIGEMGGRIAGAAMIELAEKGYVCEITPPTVLSGSELRISKLKGIQMLTVSFKTSSGQVSVILGLRKSKNKIQ